jgi:hypothetical protein
MMLQDIEAMTDAEKLALVKAIQENVASSKAKQVSLETGQYAKLVVDAIKKIKTDLEERYAEISAEIVSKSAAIRDGKDGINGAKGEKGDTGLRGLDGANGRDGVDGKDGVDGVDGNGVMDARIDFDGSLVIVLDNGTEINAGEVVPMDVAEKIKIIGNGGGTSQYVLDTLASLQASIDSISPTLVITDTFVVGSQAAMIALTAAEKGDVAVRTDINKTFILTANPYSTLGNWQELLTPTDVVTSVAGRQGAVTLSTSDISGLGTIATQNASSVSITGGTATLTSLTTASVQATNSAGLALKNSAGTTQLSMGGGGGDNLSLNVSTNINGTNAQIDISPTGTGHVHIKPTGVNSVEIAPTFVGTLDNITIGATTAKAITGTTITATTYAGGNVANWDAAYTDRNKWDGGATGLVAATGRTSLGLVIGTDVLAPTGSAASLTNFPTLNQNTTGTAASTPKLLSTNFTIEESGGKLLFKYGATTIASMSSTGLITSAANIVSNGTP